MVVLIVKGTKWPDEFHYHAPLDAPCGPLAKTLVHLQNKRYRVKLQLFSVDGLMAAAKQANPELAEAYQRRHDEIHAGLKDPRQKCNDDDYDKLWLEIRDATVALFPKECFNEAGPEAATDHLYKLHDDPDLDEDYRLHVYHCRQIMDPDYRAHEVQDEDTIAAFFAAKEMAADDVLSAYVGKNDKSRVTVKMGKRGGGAPAGEPRINYDDQRDLRRKFEAKRAEYATLEESELRDRAVAAHKRDAKASLVRPEGAGGGGGGAVPPPQAFRPIRSNATETVLEGA